MELRGLPAGKAGRQVAQLSPRDNPGFDSRSGHSTQAGRQPSSGNRKSNKARRAELRARFRIERDPTSREEREHYRLGIIPQPIIDRFWSHVDKAGPVPPLHPELGPCWLWTGAPNGKGYGQWFPYDGIHVGAHRFSLMLKLGRDMPPGEVSRHLCHVRLCCNPDHLVSGTQSQNLNDSVSDGIAFVGSHNPMARFTDEQVIDLRLRAATDYGPGWFAREARRLGTSVAVVARIVRGEAWPNLPHAVEVGSPLRGVMAKMGSPTCYRGHQKKTGRRGNKMRLKCSVCCTENMRKYRAARLVATRAA